METLPPDSAPAVLQNLIAAGLVTHELIGDPLRLEGEAAALSVLCGLIGGPVYRLEPFHYVFALAPADMEGALADQPPESRTGELAAQLAAALGDDAVWLGSTDLLPASQAAAVLGAPLLFLRAHGEAAGLAAAEPGTLAVVNARFAAETARLTAMHAAEVAGGILGAGAEVAKELDARLTGLESVFSTGIEALGARIAAAEAAPGDLERSLAAMMARLDSLATAIEALGAREERVAAQIADLGRKTEALAEAGRAEIAAAQERIGLTLAEFLAQIEARDEGGRAAARELA